MPSRILLVEDDAELCALMGEFFAQRGLEVEAVHDGRAGLAGALAGRHDLVLLDGMLPGLDGFDVLRLLRARSDVPVIFLTARAAQGDRVRGLDAGADDYVAKPFGPEELLARVRAVLRRTGRAPAGDEVEASGVRLATGSLQAWCDGREVTLTAFEFSVLEYLMRAAGRAVSREELTAALHQMESSPFDRSLDVHVSRLRKKLGDGERILTVRGVGYLFRASE